MMLSFEEKIKLLRESRELTQTELGKELKMTQRKISYLENGTYEPSLLDIKMYCLYFHVSADYLLGIPDDLDYLKK